MKNKECKLYIHTYKCDSNECDQCEYKLDKITNADKIRNMSNEELTELLEDFMECGIQYERELGACMWCCDKKCENVLEWLKKEVKE